MKKLLFFIILVSFKFSFAQTITLVPQDQNVNTKGTSINKGDTVRLTLKYSTTSGSPNIQSFYFDFQHQITALTLANITFPIAGSQNSALPSGAAGSYSNNYYPGYYWIKSSSNYTNNGLTNAQNANYGYVSGGDKSINRIQLTYGLPSNSSLTNGDLAYLNFIVNQTPAGYSYDSIYMNFVYGWTTAGQTYTVYQQRPGSSSWVDLNPYSNALINGNLFMNSNLTSNIIPQITITDSATGKVVTSVTPAQNGNFVLGSQLSPNHAYKAYVTFPYDSLPQIFSRAVTVSDYTSAQQEFIHQTLNGKPGYTNLLTGMGWLAADVNQNQVFDGGDLSLLFGQAVGADTLYSSTVIPHSYFTVPTFLSNTFDTIAKENWTEAYNNKFAVPFNTTSAVQNLNISYLIPGDINRSHSSQVINSQGQIVSNALPSLINNSNLRTSSVSTMNSNINTINDAVPSINVNLNNLTVLSDNISIPVNINTNNINLSGYQFEFVYDNSKVEFVELDNNVPNSWITTVNNKNGVIRIVSIDKQMNQPINSNSISPITLKFKSIGSGLDLSTFIKVTQNMDASDNKGNQLGINFNTQTIILTGYNNFN